MAERFGFTMHDMDAHMPMASIKTRSPLINVINFFCTQACILAFITPHLFAVSSANGTAKTITDQLGRPVRLTATPTRVVALAPSITEIMFYLELGDCLVGATQFSDYPPEAATLPKVGSYIHLDVERIAALKPDLCIAVKDGNPISAINKLESVGIPVYAVDPRNIESVMETVLELGRLLDVEDKARVLVDDMSRRVQKVRHRISKVANKPSVFLQIGITPIVSVGTNTFIHELIVMAGGVNLAQGPVPYPRFSKEQVIGLDPEVIIITSMARKVIFDQVKAEWQKWREMPAVKNNRIHLVDSDVFDRATPRLVDGLELLARLIHPECFDDAIAKALP